MPCSENAHEVNDPAFSHIRVKGSYNFYFYSEALVSRILIDFLYFPTFFKNTVLSLNNTLMLFRHIVAHSGFNTLSLIDHCRDKGLSSGGTARL